MKDSLAGLCDRHLPLFADTGIKLGVFGLNVSSAGALSRSPKWHEIEWDPNVRLVQMADEAGFEAAVPYARWRGSEGESNPWGQSFEHYCWAVGLAAQTSRFTIFTTSHCRTVSPVMAAKEIATIDHISHGRVCLNVVAGWFEKELRIAEAVKRLNGKTAVVSGALGDVGRARAGHGGHAEICRQVLGIVPQVGADSVIATDAEGAGRSGCTRWAAPARTRRKTVGSRSYRRSP